jgi:hypothetical protein
VVVAVAAAAFWHWESGPRLVYGDGKVEVVVEETLIFKKPAGEDCDSASFWDGGKRYAYLVRGNLQGFAVVDGVQGPVYDEIPYGVSFSRNGRHCAYTAERGEKQVVVVDGVEGPEYDGAGDWMLEVRGNDLSKDCYKEFLRGGSTIYSDFAFSHDGEHYAYIARDGDREFAVIDGYAEKEYDLVGRITRGGVGEVYRQIDLGNGGRYSYLARRGAKSLLVVNGKEGKEYDEVEVVWPHTWTGEEAREFDSSIYLARDGEKWCVVADGVEGKWYDVVTEWPMFSEDGKHLCYGAVEEGKTFPVRDGIEGELHDEMHVWESDSDGSPAVYVVKKDGKYRLVTDGVEGAPYDDIQYVGMSDGRTRIAYEARLGDQAMMVVDGIPGRPYDGVCCCLFSPDDSRYMYEARKGKKWTVVVDGVEGRMHDGVADLQFSPDGRHVAYTATWSNEGVADLAGELYDMTGWRFLRVERKQKEHVVVDGRQDQGYDYIWGRVFLRDSKHIAYFVRIIDKTGNDTLSIAVDGQAVREIPQWVESDTGPSGDRYAERSLKEDGTFEYVAEKEDGYYRVNGRIEDR